MNNKNSRLFCHGTYIVALENLLYKLGLDTKIRIFLKDFLVKL